MGKRVKEKYEILEIPKKGLNNQLKVIFQPKLPSGNKRVRFGVGIYTLKNHVGEHNANTAIIRALNDLSQSTRIKLRKFGIIDFYKN